MKILAIDPGNVESAYVIWDGINVIDKGKVENNKLLDFFKHNRNVDRVFIEMLASYGMPVGETVFETCVWVGRFMQVFADKYILCTKVYRIKIKNHICHSSKAKDSNIIQALVDRFGNPNKHGKYGKGTKNNQGFFYGFSKDIWQAFAVAVYSYDNLVNNNL